MRIALNLATRPYADLGPSMKRLRIGMGVLAGVCVLLFVGLHLLHNRADQARAREHSLDGQLARVTGERQGYIRMMEQPDNAALLRQVDALNQIFDQKAFSWTLAMENLETVLPGGVMVTTLEPVRDKSGVITLHLRVVGPRDLSVDLVRNLEHSRRFVHPRIVNENAESANNGNGATQRLEPVSASNRFDFDILAEYNPPTAEDLKAANGEKQSGETPAAEREQSGARRASRAEARRAEIGMHPARSNPGRRAQPAPAAVPGRLHNPSPAQQGAGR